MAHTLEIIPRRFWKNIQTGQVASFYGAVPYVNDDDKNNWQLIEDGFSIHDKTLNIIFGNTYKPYKWTFEEAQTAVNRLSMR